MLKNLEALWPERRVNGQEEGPGELGGKQPTCPKIGERLRVWGYRG